MNSNFDYHRLERIGLPECIYCESKSAGDLGQILSEVIRRKAVPALLTRLDREKFGRICARLRRKLDYDPLSRTAFLGGVFPQIPSALVSVVTAGTGDLPVAREAGRTLEYLGVAHRLFPDAGVAGLWRIQKLIGAINRADAVIAVAGMDAALVSVLGGLTPRPLIAVPSSVGYGVAASGMVALQSMLASCAPGVAVMNIENGYGAACAAFRIIRQIHGVSPHG